MRRLAPLLLLSLALPLGAVAQDRPHPDCVEVRPIARWAASAYNHYVRLENQCDRTARCQVATNVNPEAQRVSVPAGEHIEVLTYRGSPAREFTPEVTCTLDD